MRCFHFRLDRVLEVREFAEKAAEAELAKKSGAVALLELELEENAKASFDAARSRFRKGGNAQDFLAGERYAVRLAQRRDGLMKGLAMAEAQRDRAREAYVEASRARELITKLRERAEADYYKAAGREETKVLDDLAAMARQRLATAGGER
ncbi:MAG TPA: flagellar export protein FliJ [Spirochaetales bacterium]|nr:flagellar export protein FliJ [Spirochaetales bacterium]